MPVRCTTSSGNVKVEVDLLSPSAISLSDRRAHYSGYSSFLASTGLGHGAWGLGLGWGAGDKGGGPLGYESVSWSWWLFFWGRLWVWALPAR